MLPTSDLRFPCSRPAFPSKPKLIALPPGAWDTHAHVIADAGTDSFIPERRYTPAPASVDEYLMMLTTVGLTNGVLVQVSVYGDDNRVLIDALRSAPGRLRGIVTLQPDASDATLRELDAAGVRGVRILEAPGSVGFVSLESSAAMCTEMGWHVQLCTEAREFYELLPRLQRMTLPIVLEDMGECIFSDCARERQGIIDYVNGSHSYIKLASHYRFSSCGYPFSDLQAGVVDLVSKASERVIWGSDWPHVAVAGDMPKVGELLDALSEWGITDEATVSKIFVENPTHI